MNVERGFDERAQTVDEVFQHVRDEIVTGTLAPWDRLDDRRIASSLSVPRVLVREALLRLQRVGLARAVEARRHRVAEASPEAFHHAVDYLASQLEIALRLAIPRMNASVRDFATMLAHTAAASCLATPLSKPAVYERAFALWDSVVETAANPVLRVAFDRAWRDLLANSWGAQLFIDQPESLAEHLRELSAAIATSDSASAERTIRRAFVRSPHRSIT